jgi:hypothetical protein
MRRWPVVGAGLCVVVAGCTAESPADGAAAGEGWTVLVYSIADTDLEPYLLADLAEFAEVGSNENLQIAAMVDRAADYSADPLLGLDDWVGAKYLSVGQGEATELADLGELDTGDPTALSDFIAQGIEDHPAEHYALVISDHGASWPGVGGDESAGHSTLTLDELRSGIGDGLAAAGVDQLDLLGFDACLMATYETASVMAPLADRMIASQELEPGHGWDYGAFQVLADDPATDVDTLGTAIVDGFQAQAEDEGTGADITLSMIDLAQMAAVDEAVATFSAALTERVADVAPVVGRERESVLGFGRDADPTVDTHMADLGLLASQIGAQALDVSDAADTVITAINDAVVHKVAGPAALGASGLSIYFPPTPELLDADYASVESAEAWGEFLASYYGAGDAIPAEEQPAFRNADGLAEFFFDEDGLNLVGTFDLAAADNLASATISYGQVAEDGSVVFFGEEPAEVAEDGSGTALGIYDLTTMTISDGIDTSYAYLTLTVDDEAEVATMDVPLAYYAPGEDVYQDVTLSITYDPESGDILNETYYSFDPDSGTYGELYADAEGLIVPKLLTVAPDGSRSWEPATDVGLYADLPALQYDFEPLSSGTELYAELTVADFGGNSDSVSAPVVVP